VPDREPPLNGHYLLAVQRYADQEVDGTAGLAQIVKLVVPKYLPVTFSSRSGCSVSSSTSAMSGLCRQRGIGLVKGHAMRDHVHLFLSIPPKHSVAHAIGFLKGKSSVRIHRELLHESRMTGPHFWSTVYCVSTVGLDEARVRQYIRE
jgi:putative transposase